MAPQRVNKRKAEASRDASKQARKTSKSSKQPSVQRHTSQQISKSDDPTSEPTTSPTTTPHSKTGMLHLPVELIEAIAIFLPKRDLLQVRLACKALTRSTQNVVAKACFTDLSFFLFNSRSMAVLCLISQHPIFSRSVRSVRLSSAILQLPSADYRLRLESMPGEARDVRSTRRKYRRRYESHNETQKDFIATRAPALWLALALDDFGKVGNVPSIRMTDIGLDQQEKPWGHKHFAQLLGYEDPFTPLVLDNPYKAIWDAQYESKSPTRHLHLGFGSFPVPTAMFQLSPGDLCLKHLATLELFLKSSPDVASTGDQGAWDIAEQAAYDLESLSSMLLDEMPRLEHLSVSFAGPLSFNPERLSMDRMLLTSADASLMSLKSMHLAGQMLDLMTLLRFVRVRRHTLRKVHVNQCHYGVEAHLDAKERIAAQYAERDQDVSGSTNDLEPPLINVSDSWNGTAWLQEWVGTPISDEEAHDFFDAPSRLLTESSERYLEENPPDKWKGMDGGPL